MCQRAMRLPLRMVGEWVVCVRALLYYNVLVITRRHNVCVACRLFICSFAVPFLSYVG